MTDDIQPGDGGVVYTETVVHSAPEPLLSQAPYQIVIVILDKGGRQTGRIEGERVEIGHRVVVTGVRDGVVFFGRSL